LTEVQCPVCGKVYNIPESRGRTIVETRFLHHKDHCQLPAEDEFVRAGGRVGIIVEVLVRPKGFPFFTVQFPSGKMRDFSAREVMRFEDQEDGRRRFFE
jgi:hypothetical protein